MGIELVILDFDGTVTEVDQEATPAVESWRTDIGNELGLSASEIDRKWLEAQTKIEANPAKYGWIMGNKIVAPAYADPLVMARTISDYLFDQFGVYLNRQEREEILQNRFFKGNYVKAGTFFKGDANNFLRGVSDKFDVCIVTNSGTGDVVKKMAQLPAKYPTIPIHGDAKKYVLDSGWKEVPESVERAGYGRPLFLQRRRYATVLSGLMVDRELKPEQVAVVGDIYELDLLLPEHQGMHIILTPRDSTPTFEVEAVRTSPTGYVARNLTDVLEHLKEKN